MGSMTIRVIRRTFIVGLGMMLGALWSVPAHAAGAAAVSAVSVTRGTLSVDTDIPPGVTVDLVRRTMVLDAGENRHLHARLEATSSTTGIVGLTERIRCLNASGATASVVAASARNHEGSDTTTYATPGHLPLYADLLFTAPTAGTYTCILQGTAYSSLTGSYHLTAVADNTWLETDDADQTGARWWQNPACESNDSTGACTYVGDGAARRNAWVFYDDGTPVYKWQAHPDAVSVSAQANLELTTCYQGTASCAAGMQAYPRGENAVVDTRLDFIQLDATGHTCRTHSTTARRTITDDAHHAVGYFSLSAVPIDSACGTRTFILRVYVAYVSGQTVKIDGIQSGTTSLTNGIAFNNF
ncbi:hypothetical protein [Streptomyces sp. NBC_00151]|uniref:hypothetical protein n=1 Tax=Streptomyces sp. NBC_00151 TaxID=2975669 RepID=UPI002DDC5389|nr:hypothetical protein [Streptomyces sp. NBC_00151]WRZ39142.1 hypothetical protein OG915_14485 [Streptomyces sp. NBC_00151]